MGMAATASAQAPAKMAAPATTSPASASAPLVWKEITVKTVALLATLEKLVKSSVYSSALQATVTACLGCVSVGQAGLALPVTCPVRPLFGDPTV